MNKKIYTTPNIDVVELQGEVAIAAGSNPNEVNEDPVGGDVSISIDGTSIGTPSDQGGARSGAYSQVTKAVLAQEPTSTYGKMNNRII